MKRILSGALVIGMVAVSGYAADMQQEDAEIGLRVPQIIELVGIDMRETITPGPEDYARDLTRTNIVNYPDGNAAAGPNTMDPSNAGIGKGFAERADAISITLFTNAQDGANLYIHGVQPAGPQGVLRLDDTYLTVQTEKTYVLLNKLEGSEASAQTYPSETNMTRVTWLRIHNEAQYLFGVKMSTSDPRLVVFKLGVANLARYTEGEYSNTLTFTLIPIVG
ncbi:hypothetical protein AUJ95_01220 [Candidatus Desantisbacteria bacterium CG2_30_40_21]|uniref:Uncharacterized protein n=5 Tax=unclassified Candidatus Desantisiibacteriota TaxID=3106372 RepID=A0A2M7JDG8_9BACT|nr:MAG: hypothetical protein AUJ95_01220 [Candidatus Desantisbacteria bacterium CG2_30_40_21]PIP40238.1 MAG: hypothetical protein COX18_07430 [Candidatus Desantisbacteria bacterium CG23_combo_of_CG06-09_8_20_14_all_40_23]PIX17455.1 MAG: hypothetical protein COZ71_03210 [Candidatus Desantisbacteria bacterium CG_4_8_14_3_um_filter_40_12]PIY18880.1 MAG: hypothetical protein COZ13_08255 [Candidatus Desantisbacteria bacterium CG_4_10_14_3_um_filter_40_18]PJB29972.1 MAG: hypothetical protein CO110_03